MLVLDSPPGRVEMLMDGLLWPGHPLGRDIAGTRESVSAISRQDMVEFAVQHYIPETTVIAVAGNLTHAEAVTTVKDRMGSWRGAGNRPSFLPFAPARNGPRRRN